MSDGQSEKDNGNAAFRRGDYATALEHYDQAIKNAGGGADAALYSNKAAALHKLRKYDLCIEQCWKGLAADGLTPELKSKIYFRIALAFEAQAAYGVAINAILNCERSPTVLEKTGELLARLSVSDPEGMHDLRNRMLQSAHANGHNAKAFALALDRLNFGTPDERWTLSPPHGDCSKPGRAELISEHANFLKIFKEAALSQYYSLPVRFDMLDNATSSHVSTALLFDLKRITISQLRLDEVNLGKLLICRTITEPFMTVALSTLIEDPTGEATRLAVYNLRSPTNDVNSLMPSGTYLAIREPWYKEDGISGKLTLRIDNPTNLMYLDQSHDLLKNVEWRSFTPEPASSFSVDAPEMWQSHQKRGNELFVAGNYELAVAAYTDAVELKRTVAPKEVADLLSNRAAAYLGDEKPTDAFWACTSALFVQPDHLKATFRLAKAHASLSKYEEAKALLEKSPHTTRPEFQTEISRLNRLLREQKFGVYDLKTMLKEAAASKTPRLDHADYNGSVRVQCISMEKGNGLVAQRDFAPGDLLFVSKAFQVTYEYEYNAELRLPADKAVFTDDLHSECVSRVIRRLSKNKDLVETGTDESLAVDSKRVAAIVGQNAFGSDSFQAVVSACGGEINSAGAGFAFGGCGVWILPSFMNHSCVPNTVIFYAGDLMIVRAAKGIRKGDELTTSYTSLWQDYAKRQETLKTRGVKCDCELCICDLERLRSQPNLDEQREAFMAPFLGELADQLRAAVQKNQTKSVAKLTEDVRKLAEEFSRWLSYKNRYDPCLEKLYFTLAYGYNAQRQWLKSVRAFEMAYFAAVGNQGINAGDMFISHTLPLDVFSHSCSITNNAQLCMDFDMARKYLGKMQQAAKICWGSADKEFLAMLYPDIPVKQMFESLI